MTSSSQAEIFNRPAEKKPFYPPYDFDRDLVRTGARDRIANYMEDIDLKKQAERYRVCRKRAFSLECEHGSHKCENPSHGSARGGYRGVYLARETCKSRICEPCAKDFGLRFRRRLKPFVEGLQGQSGKRRLKFLTFTWKQGDYEITPEWIRGALKQVGKVMRKYFCQKSKNGHALGGGLAILEMSPAGFFHVHALAYGYYVPLKELSAYWEKITQDSYRCDIQDAENRATNALDELIKYIVKPVSLRCPECGRSLKPNMPYCPECFTIIENDQERIVEVMTRYITAIKGRRRIHSWGIFYGADELKIPKGSAACPFCGSPLKLFSSDSFDDGSIWPVWAVFAALEHHQESTLPARYG